MNKSFTIAKWDFYQKVKRKSFLFFVLFFPVILIAIGILPGLLQSNNAIDNKRVGIIDNEHILTDKFVNILNESPDKKIEFEKIDLPDFNLTQKISFAEQLLETNNLSGYLVLKNNSGKLTAELHNNYEFNYNDRLTIQNLFLTTYLKLNPGNNLFKEFELVEIKKEKKNGSLLSKFYSSYILTMLLALMILVNGGMMTRSLREEKNNRLIELYLSSASVQDLLYGKMISLTLIATIQIITWGIIIFLFRDSEYLLTAGNNLLLILIFIITAFVFYSSIFIGLGALISTEQESQQVNSILSIILIFPIVISTMIIDTPGSFVSQVLSYFPFTSAPIMIMRINVSSPNFVEIILSLGILILSAILFVKASSKLFKIGMLSFDNKLVFTDVKKILLNKSN
jgi:ABC-2 type transport system permease protein